MPVYTINDLFDLDKTIASSLFLDIIYPYEALAGIGGYILALGPALSAGRFDHPADGVWVAKNARVAPSASISGPCIVDEGAELRHCAFVRGAVIVGKGAVVGNSTELKNAVLFDGVQAPHFNYVGDSILGHKAHLGAGVITTNVKSDKSPVILRASDESIPTGRKKVGLAAGDFVEVGCNSALAPGCVLGRGTQVYPVSHVRGQVPHHHIYKAPGVIAPRLASGAAE
jgi:bifunctional N-acetylglucosamine-1-phosphate-uridyltransferase/glucosamine-1-phosphate-acetyltransferase GlmU-like protein